MPYLVAVTALWAFSFSLIGAYLSGQVDNYFSVMTRVVLAAIVFLPFLRPKLLSVKQTVMLMLLGATQLGIMYIFFYQAFLYLSVPEILLFKTFTPIYIALLNDLGEKRFNPIYLITAFLAVIGASVIHYEGVNRNFWIGFLLIQGADVCFALGQVGYRRLTKQLPKELPWHNAFGWFFIGAVLVAVPAFLMFGNTAKLPTTGLQWGVLLWLGLVASGVGYFLWNQGATKVDAGTLAVMNNALIPAGLIVNLVIWNSNVDLIRLAIGGAIILFALWLNDWLLKRQQTAYSV